jgi:AcrR family transcriptional regulator
MPAPQPSAESTPARRADARHDAAGRRPAAHSGRRPGESGARDAHLVAARALFAQHGFERATIRAVAAQAGVDPALVHHYFGSKEQLFEAALTLPIAPAVILPRLLQEDPDHVGERIVHIFLSTWERPANRRVLLAMLRSAASNEQATALVRRRLMAEVFGPLASLLDVPDAELRVSLVGSQLIGLALMRYVARIEPVASASVDAVAAAVGPTVQRYLTGDLSCGP